MDPLKIFGRKRNSFIKKLEHLRDVYSTSVMKQIQTVRFILFKPLASFFFLNKIS